jgi:hypothetical protein
VLVLELRIKIYSAKASLISLCLII